MCANGARGLWRRLYRKWAVKAWYFGKPAHHRSMIWPDRKALMRWNKDISDSGILAIGDGIHTDIKGAWAKISRFRFSSPAGLPRGERKPKPNPIPDALTAIWKRKHRPDLHDWAPTLTHFSFAFLRLQSN